MSNFNPPTRNQLSAIVQGDNQLLLAFEQLFQAVGETLPDNNQSIDEKIQTNVEDISNNSDEIDEIKGVLKLRAAAYHMIDNSDVTTISNANEAVKISGETISSILVGRFAVTDNKATYSDNLAAKFKIEVVAKTNIEAAIFIAINETVLNQSVAIGTKNIHAIGTNDLANGGFVEIYIANPNNNTDIVVENLNVIIEAII